MRLAPVNGRAEAIPEPLEAQGPEVGEGSSLVVHMVDTYPGRAYPRFTSLVEPVRSEAIVDIGDAAREHR
ncbi:hypothetical protein GCM10009838_27890 [Catenulispora subtropica]|uniref:Uncharacterized protein n=1 Tax=Catenulispora subtropica TaxID=450798 RepID=A0ABP5CRW9_9ACTN